MFVERGGQVASVREIAFILADAPGLIDALETLGPEVAVVVVDALGDGLQAIAAALARRRDLAVIHIVAWGEPGVLHLGRLSLDLRSLAGRAGCVAALGAALATRARSGCTMRRFPQAPRARRFSPPSRLSPRVACRPSPPRACRWRPEVRAFRRSFACHGRVAAVREGLHR
jgi:hypothetical protein